MKISFVLLILLVLLHEYSFSEVPLPWTVHSWQGKQYYYNEITGESQWEPPMVVNTQSNYIHSFDSVTANNYDKNDNSNYNNYPLPENHPNLVASIDMSPYRRPIRRHSLLGNRTTSATSHLQNKQDSSLSSIYDNQRNENQHQQSTEEIVDVSSSSSSSSPFHKYDERDDRYFDSSNFNQRRQSSHHPHLQHQEGIIQGDNSKEEEKNIDLISNDFYIEHIDFLESQLETYEEKMDVLSHEKASMIKRSKKITEDISKLQEQNKLFESNIQIIKKESENYRNLANKRKKDLDNQKRIIVRLEKEVEQLKQQNKPLSPMKEAKVTIHNQENNNSIVKESNTKLSSNIISNSKRIVLMGNLDEKDEIIQELWSFIDELKVDNTKSEQKWMILKQELEILTRTHSHVENNLHFREKEKLELQSTIQELKTQMELLEQEWMKTKEDLIQSHESTELVIQYYQSKISTMSESIEQDAIRVASVIQELQVENERLQEALEVERSRVMIIEPAIERKSFLSTLPNMKSVFLSFTHKIGWFLAFVGLKIKN